MPGDCCVLGMITGRKNSEPARNMITRQAHGKRVVKALWATWRVGPRQRRLLVRLGNYGT